MKIFRRMFIFAVLALFTIANLHAEKTDAFSTTSQEEALFLRRIAEFWEDQEFEIAKKQILSYLEKYPQTPLSDSLYAVLGNLYMNEKNYSLALSAYENITSDEIKDKVSINYISGLYHLKWYERLIDECDKYIEKSQADLQEKLKYIQALSLFNQSSEEKDSNKKNEFVIKAKEKFEALLSSKFELEAREYLTQIYSSLQDFENAALHYMDLAEKNISRKDEYLFQAALLQAHFNKELALQTFSHITNGKSKKSKDAAYNKVLLLFELKKYEDLISEKENLLSLLEEDQLYVANFFIGRSYFNLKDYENAKNHLNISLQMEDKTSIQMKLALVMLMQSSYNLNDLNSFDFSFNMFLEKFPEDENLFDSYFAKALINKKNLLLDEAKAVFEKMSTKFNDLETRDIYLFEYAHLLYQLNDYKNSKPKFRRFIQNFDNNVNTKNALAFLVNCSIMSLKDAKTPDERTSFRTSLIEDIELLFTKEYLFDQKDKYHYRFLLAQTHFDLQNYSLCLDILDTLINENPEAEVLNNSEKYLSLEDYAQINILKGFCHKNLSNDLKNFTLFAEKGLLLLPVYDSALSTYINLFNSYLELAKLDEKTSDINIENAAISLFKGYKISPNEISTNNLFWLSDYFLSKVKYFLEENYLNNLSLNTKLSSYLENAMLILSNLKKLDPKQELDVKLSYLLAAKKDFIAAKELLLLNLKDIRMQPDKLWPYKEELIYKLAKIHDSLNEKKEAISLYEEFLPTFSKESPFKPCSLLHSAKLELSFIKPEEININNLSLEKIISNLKIVSLQKVYENEPVHLEASIEYIDLLCQMEKNRFFEKRLFLLGRMKENFTTLDDMISQDYHTMRKTLKDKEPIYNGYIEAIEADRLITMGYLGKKSSHIEIAKTTISKIKEKNLITTNFLNNYIERLSKLIEEFKVDK